MSNGNQERRADRYWVAVQLVLMFGFLLLPVAPPGRIASPRALAALSTWGAGPLLTVAALLLVAGLLALGRRLSPFPTPRAGATLVTTGVFRWVRHPLYVAVMLGGAGYALQRQSPLHLALVPILLVFFDLKARREERILDRRFPDYASYRRRVARFLPGIY